MPTEAPEKPTVEANDVRSSFKGRVDTQQTGATLTGLRNAGDFISSAEDMIIPDVKDVVEESTSHHHPRGSASTGRRQAEWLSTHPADTTRLADIRRWLPEAMKYYRPRN